MMTNKQKLGALTTKIGSGVTPKGGEASYKKSGIPLVRSQNVLAGVLDLSDVAYIDDAQHQRMSGSIVKPYDVLLNITGASIGRCCLVPEWLEDANVNQHVCIIRPTVSLNPGYLMQFLNSDQGQNLIVSYQAGGNRQGLNYQQIASFEIPVPPLPEQERIAAILSTWDEAIAKTQSLIERKEWVKQFYVENIFEERLKFKDFKKKLWVELKLKGIIDDFIVPMRDKPKVFSGNIPWCRIEDFNGKYLIDSKSGQYVDNSIIESMNLKVYPIDTVIVSCSADLGRCAIVKKPLVTNQTFIGLVPSKKIDPEFLFYLMSYNARNLKRLSSGTTIAYLSREEFEKFSVLLPESLEEQAQVVFFLSYIDEELCLLKNQLGQLKTQKQGLMQKLLSGAWSVAAGEPSQLQGVAG